MEGQRLRLSYGRFGGNMSYPLSWCPLQSIYWRPPCRPTRFTPRSSRFSQVVQFSACRGCCFIVCSVLVRLGYFIGLSESVPVIQTRIRFLGFLSDSILQAFLIPQDKRIKFATLRDSILQCRTVSIKTLQRFAGKVTSFSLAVPAARLYTREVYRAISLANRFSRPIKVVGS